MSEGAARTDRRILQKLFRYIIFKIYAVSYNGRIQK